MCKHKITKQSYLVIIINLYDDEILITCKIQQGLIINIFGIDKEDLFKTLSSYA